MRYNASSSRNRHTGRLYWPTVAFLLGFALLIAVVAHWYLLPALSASEHADTIQKRQLAATARLMLAIVLFILIAGLILTFRIGRFFNPRHGNPAAPTKYVDAWAESAKRVVVPPDEEES